MTAPWHEHDVTAALQDHADRVAAAVQAATLRRQVVRQSLSALATVPLDARPQPPRQARAETARFVHHVATTSRLLTGYFGPSELAAAVDDVGDWCREQVPGHAEGLIDQLASVLARVLVVAEQGIEDATRLVPGR